MRKSVTVALVFCFLSLFVEISTNDRGELEVIELLRHKRSADPEPRRGRGGYRAGGYRSRRSRSYRNAQPNGGGAYYGTNEGKKRRSFGLTEKVDKILIALNISIALVFIVK